MPSVSMNPFRQSVKAVTKRSGGKGRGGSWYDRYRIPEDVATPFVIVNAEYVDPFPPPERMELDPATGRPKDVTNSFFKSRKHVIQHGTKQQPKIRDAVCSAGYNPHAPQPCAGCTYQDQGGANMKLSEVYSFTIVHLATYHRHPLIDKQTGGVVMKRDSNPPVPVTVDSECTGRTCNFCRAMQGLQLIHDPQNPWPQALRVQDIQNVFGRRRYIELGKNHLEDLLAWDATVSSLCGNDGAQLITDGFACPYCNNLCIDMSQDTRTDAEIQAAVAQPYPCLRCQRPVLLREVVACEVCEANNRQPLQFSLFGRVLWGMRQGKDTNSHLVLQRHESIEEFGARVPAQLLGGKTLRQVIEEIGQPFDFGKIYEPLSVPDQVKRLEIQQQTFQPGYGAPMQPMQPGMMYAPAGAPGYPTYPPNAPVPGAPAYAPYPGAPGQVPMQPVPAPAPQQTFVPSMPAQAPIQPVGGPAPTNAQPAAPGVIPQMTPRR